MLHDWVVRDIWSDFGLDEMDEPSDDDMSGGSQDGAQWDSDFTDDTDSGEEAVLDSSAEFSLTTQRLGEGRGLTSPPPRTHFIPLRQPLLDELKAAFEQCQAHQSSG